MYWSGTLKRWFGLVRFAYMTIKKKENKQTFAEKYMNISYDVFLSNFTEIGCNISNHLCTQFDALVLREIWLIWTLNTIRQYSNLQNMNATKAEHFVIFFKCVRFVLLFHFLCNTYLLMSIAVNYSDSNLITKKRWQMWYYQWFEEKSD